MPAGAQFDPFELTALVLDENEFERGISIDQLRSMGFARVFEASEAGEAWDCLCEHNPSMLLMEWMGVGESGLALVKRIRHGADAPNRALPIFMLTSRGRRTDIELARYTGVDAFMRKPISRKTLEDHVRQVVSKPQPFIVTEAFVGPCRRRRADRTYAGPFRRLEDVVPKAAPACDAEAAVKDNLARAALSVLEGRAEKLNANDADAARLVFQSVQELARVAEQIGDASLALGAKEMARYLQAQGATDRLEPEVVRIHVAALHQLVHLPFTNGDERERVAQSLQRMVDKKLGRAA